MDPIGQTARFAILAVTQNSLPDLPPGPAGDASSIHLLRLTICSATRSHSRIGTGELPFRMPWLPVAISVIHPPDLHTQDQSPEQILATLRRSWEQFVAIEVTLTTTNCASAAQSPKATEPDATADTND